MTTSSGERDRSGRDGDGKDVEVFLQVSMREVGVVRGDDILLGGP